MYIKKEKIKLYLEKNNYFSFANGKYNDTYLYNIIYILCN